jgi:hypothetical protein
MTLPKTIRRKAGISAANQVDPIFAAIDLHKREGRRLDNWYCREATEEAARACRKWSRTTPVGKIVPTTWPALQPYSRSIAPGSHGKTDTAWTPRAAKNVLVALKRLAADR